MDTRESATTGAHADTETAAPSAAAFALSQADRLAAVGQLAAGLAHEMNTPLASISAHAEEGLDLVDRSGDGPLATERCRELRGRLQAIMRQAHRCGRIATRLLQFAHPEAPEYRRSRVDRVVEDAIELFEPAAAKHGVCLERAVPTDLPDAPLDPAELEQLLVNLLQNALDACGSGAIVRVEASAVNGSLKLIVSDTGCGIPREHLPRIFDPFFTTKPVGQGTGLGLSVCLGMVRRVGGSIDVDSVPGRGTRVVVTLPMEPDRAAPRRRHRASRAKRVES